MSPRRDPQSPLERVMIALEALETALRSGNLTRLEALEAEIADASEALAGSGAPIRVLTDLRTRTRRLAAMLAAAQAGVGAARQRLNEVVQAREGLGTYDRAGARRVLPADASHRLRSRT